MSSHNETHDALAVVIVPGIGNSGPQHWQTLWERQHPAWQRLQQRDWDRPVCDEWVSRLDDAIGRLPVPPLLIAHSMGCLVVAHWAHRSSAPFAQHFWWQFPTLEGPSFPSAAQGFHPLPAGKFRFPSLLVASSDDPFGSLSYAKRCAVEWGSVFIDIGAAGHINTDSGLGDWPAGWALFERLLKVSRRSGETKPAG